MRGPLATSLRQRVTTLRWVLPLAIGLLAVLYEIAPGRWIHDHLGAGNYFEIDILFYATAAPLLSFGVLTGIGHWLDEKEQAEQHAQVTEQRLASIIASSADAIFSLDSTGRIEAWNRGAELIFGYSARDIIGRPLTDLLGRGEAAEVELRWLFSALQQADFVRGHETTCWDSAGRQVAVELTITRLTGEKGGADGSAVILRDVTERRLREAEIRRLNTSLSEQVADRTRQLADKVDELAQANAELQKLDQMRGEFVSVVSHQIRAPLTNMRGAVERMRHDCPAVCQTCTRMFVILNQQTERLDHLVRDVLGVARLEAGELVLQAEPISVLPVVQQVAEQMRVRSAGRPIRLPVKPGLPPVFADRERLAEVLANLLDNADKYSPPGREIGIDVRADQTEVTLSVSDLGRGVPDADLERIFDKFYRVDNSDAQAVYGYGLGLYICRELVRAQGGHIWAQNRPEGGAQFSFTLPVAG